MKNCITVIQLPTSRRILQLYNCNNCDFLESHKVKNYMSYILSSYNSLNAELNPICCLLALLGAHHFLHVSSIRVKSLTLRLLISYIYMEHLFLMFLDHTLPAAAHLLRSWVRIPPEAWIFVCCECRVLSGRGLCDELITRPEESYRLCCVVVCDLETSSIGAPYIYMKLVA